MSNFAVLRLGVKIRSRGSRISRLKLFRHGFLAADDARQRAECVAASSKLTPGLARFDPALCASHSKVSMGNVELAGAVAANKKAAFVAPKLFENVIASRVGSDSLTAPFFAPFTAIK